MAYKLKGDRLFVLFIVLLCFALYFLPSGFPDREDGYVRSKALVLSVDNSYVYQRGVVKPARKM